MSNSEFIEQIAKYVKKYAVEYGIKVHSPIIAQAILESGWGRSKLASKYHNYFGLKCGSAWTGKSVNMQTSEEYEVGVHTQIRDNFRVFDDMDSGVKGYFDFISYSRYANLKGVTDAETYVNNIKADGYATSSTYVSNIMRVIIDNNLTRFDGNVGDDIKKEELISEILSGNEIVEILANRVINGDYGNGFVRQHKLGVLYSIVQQRVNELCR